MWVFACSSEENSPEASNDEVKVYFVYTLDTSTGNHMTRAAETNSEVFNEFYQKIKTGDLVAHTTSKLIAENSEEKFREVVKAHETEAEKRRKRADEKKAEKLEAEKILEDGILEVLGDEPMTATDIAEAVEGINTPQKATVVVKRLVAAGLANVQDIKGKKGKVKGYTAA